MATLWSMSPWAGLKRRHILEACRSSLMSNLPHQKTFIPINKAFGKGALHRLSAVPTAQRSVCDCRSVCAINRGYVGEGKLCEGFILGCAGRRGCHHYFFHCWCLHLHFGQYFKFKCAWLWRFGVFFFLTEGLTDGLDQKCKIMFMHITNGSKQGKNKKLIHQMSARHSDQAISHFLLHKETHGHPLMVCGCPEELPGGKVLKMNSNFFSCLGEFCKAVLLWRSRRRNVTRGIFISW